MGTCTVRNLPWQIWCLVGALVVVAVFVGLRSEWLTGAVASALGGVLGAAVVGFAANGSEGASFSTFAGALWGFPVFLGVLLVAGTVYAVRTRQWRTVRYRRTV